MGDTSELNTCPTGIIYHEKYLEHDTGNHPESADRIEHVHKVLRAETGDWNVTWQEPRSASLDELKLVHDPTYIEFLRKFSQAGGGSIWVDTACSRNSFEVARLAVGGVLESIDAVMKGQLQNAFALVRPPGHHAMPDRAQGFCLFNNVAVGARYLQKVHGIERILVIDWDCHHGNGTEHVFFDEASVLYFSLHEEMTYPGTGRAQEVGFSEGTGYNVNVPLPPGCGDGVSKEVFLELLAPIALQYGPEFILVSAGQDAHHADGFSTMQMTAPGFGRLAQITADLANKCCDGRLVLAQEGGYNPVALAHSILAILSSCVGRHNEVPDPFTRPGEKDPEIALQYLEQVKHIQRAYWADL